MERSVGYMQSAYSTLLNTRSHPNLWFFCSLLILTGPERFLARAVGMTGRGCICPTSNEVPATTAPRCKLKVMSSDPSYNKQWILGETMFNNSTSPRELTEWSMNCLCEEQIFNECEVQLEQEDSYYGQMKQSNNPFILWVKLLACLMVLCINI